MREKILKLIDRNSKLSFKDIAVMLGEDEADIITEISKMEQEKVICGYTTLINWDIAEGEDVRALIEVKVTPQRGHGFDEIAERIYKYEEVEACYLMSGTFDLTVMVKGKSLKEVAKFVAIKLATMDAVESCATHFLLKKYKEHGIALTEPKSDERMLITP